MQVLLRLKEWPVNDTGFVVGVLCRRLKPKCCLLMVATGIKLFVRIIYHKQQNPFKSFPIPILISHIADLTWSLAYVFFVPSGVDLSQFI